MIGSRARGNRAMHVLGAVDDLIMIIKADRCVVVLVLFFLVFFILETLFFRLVQVFV